MIYFPSDFLPVSGGEAGPGPYSQPQPQQPVDAATRLQLRRSLKVTWDPQLKDWTSLQLRAAFEVHGQVEDVILRDR